jgi:hypothetical protein
MRTIACTAEFQSSRNLASVLVVSRLRPDFIDIAIVTVRVDSAVSLWSAYQFKDAYSSYLAELITILDRHCEEVNIWT